LKLNQTKLHLI